LREVFPHPATDTINGIATGTKLACAGYHFPQTDTRPPSARAGGLWNCSPTLKGWGEGLGRRVGAKGWDEGLGLEIVQKGRNTKIKLNGETLATLSKIDSGLIGHEVEF